jgi:signal recognition particle GTPase
MGDVVLVERAQEQFDEEARRIQKKIAKTNLVLMISYPNSTGEENNMKDLVGMIPGASKP